MIVLVMGVAGSGKTTVGELLAERLGWAFVDADAYHPAANVAKMARGIALSDEDRAPWLAQLAVLVHAARAERRSLVLACSALRRAYRELLLGGRRDDVLLVHLEGRAALIRARMEQRTHFMPPGALDGQIVTLEAPGDDEAPLILDVALPAAALVETIVARLDVTAREAEEPDATEQGATGEG
jgi:carbohydrate kinase (thermoresistant glucokinase family)